MGGETGPRASRAHVLNMGKDSKSARTAGGGKCSDKHMHRGFASTEEGV